MRASLSVPLSFLLLTTYVLERVACMWGDTRSLWQQPLNHSDLVSGTFPKGFLWGVGTSAFPTEGSWDRDGKGESIWDHFTHLSHHRTWGSVGTSTADTASDSYTLWEKDIESLQYLGAKFYAFSISWPRLFPDGSPTGRVNSVGVEYYRRLIVRLKGLGLEPIVTLYHWDLPQALQEHLGGWKNPEMVQIFADYAAFCFATFGKDVQYWITMHNPLLVAVLGYGTGAHAPGVTGDPADPFIVAHNLIRAHAKAWHIYDKQFRPSQRGQISITLSSHWVEPFKGHATPVNLELCQKSIEAVIGWFAEPIHGCGDYPRSLLSSNRGLVPEFTPEERVRVRGTADFFSLAFGPDTVRAARGFAHFGQMGALDLRKVLGWIQLKYSDPKVLVAESGWFSNASVGVEDTLAIYLMKRFIYQVLQAVVVDHVKVFGYTAWSLVDGFEWNNGYSIRRGLFYIDFDQPQRSRFPKTTAQYYRRVIKDNGFPNDETEQNINGHFPCDFHFGVADFILKVHLQPFSPQFTDPLLYRWNFSGNGALQPVAGVMLHTRPAQCSDFLAIQCHVRLLEMTGASHYRFALDWAQLLPNGDTSSVDAESVRYYRCMFMELQRKGIKATVTLYHPSLSSATLGLPGPLHAHGGWMNTSTMEAFVDYATFCYREFGPLVPIWITVNEPNRLAEAYNRQDQDRDIVVRNLLLAHARAWKVYHTRFHQQQQGMVSFAVHADWVEPANPFMESHNHAVQCFLLFELGHFLDPFLGNFDNPNKNPCHSGSHPSSFHQPELSENERDELKGALDFIALNHFTTRLVYTEHTHQAGKNSHFKYPNNDHGCSFISDPTWPTSKKGQAVTPWGLRRVLQWLKNRYGNHRSFIVTATGIDDQESYNDQLRQSYIKSYLQEALKARELDGVDLRGFYVWKLQDHHTPDFGFFGSRHHRSQPKASLQVYRELISQRGFDTVPSPCDRSEKRTDCWLCSTVSENKPLIFFGVCVTISLLLLSGVIVTSAMKMRGRGRGKRKKRSVQAVPQSLRRERGFAMQRVAYRI